MGALDRQRLILYTEGRAILMIPLHEFLKPRNELFQRLSKDQRIIFQLVVATFFINLLALATSLFVIQVLNRYISHRVNAILTTLATGTLIAIGLHPGNFIGRCIVDIDQYRRRQVREMAIKLCPAQNNSNFKAFGCSTEGITISRP